MAGLEPFSPDDDYCVYCHAPAAGMCAECGALCCGECVELVMGWTTQRAICDSCARTSDAPASTSASSRLWLVGLVTFGLVTLYFLAR